MILKIKKINFDIIRLFFFLMLVFPASFQLERGALLILICLISLYKIPINDFIINKSILFIAIINIFNSLLFTLIGVLNSAPGALKVSSVYVFWPIIFLYFIGYNNKLSNLIPFINIIFYSCLVSIILIILFIVNEFFFTPFHNAITLISKAQDYQSGFFGGFIQLHTGNLTTVFYTFIFIFTIYFIPKNLNSYSKVRGLFLPTIILSIILLLISGRRAFWLICIVSPFIIIFFLRLVKIKIHLSKFILPTILVFSLIAISFSILSLDKKFILDRLESSFEFNNPDAISNYLRKEQSDALIHGWLDSPILGHGLGATAKGSIRDPNAPWSYELSYWALLFQTGILGFLIYLFSVIWIFIKSILVMKKNQSTIYLLIPQLVALFCFLIVNASNPYLAKFDYLWTLYLPIATLNAILVEENRNKKHNLKLT